MLYVDVFLKLNEERQGTPKIILHYDALINWPLIEVV